jgi:Alkylmercury lyase
VDGATYRHVEQLEHLIAGPPGPVVPAGQIADPSRSYVPGRGDITRRGNAPYLLQRIPQHVECRPSCGGIDAGAPGPGCVHHRPHQAGAGDVVAAQQPEPERSDRPEPPLAVLDGEPRVLHPTLLDQTSRCLQLAANLLQPGDAFPFHLLRGPCRLAAFGAPQYVPQPAPETGGRGGGRNSTVWCGGVWNSSVRNDLGFLNENNGHGSDPPEVGVVVPKILRPARAERIPQGGNESWNPTSGISRDTAGARIAGMDPEDLRLTVYRSFAEAGRAPDLTRLAEHVDHEPATIRRGLRQLAQARHLVLDAQDAVVMAHPFSAVPLGFSVMGERTLWWGGCAWDSFALPNLLLEDTDMLVSTRCPACSHAHAWNVGRSGPPSGDQVVHFLVPAAHMWDDVVHTCRHQRIFCSVGCVDDWVSHTRVERGYVMDLATLWRLASHWYDGRLQRGYTRRDPAAAADYLRGVGLTGPFWGP